MESERRSYSSKGRKRSLIIDIDGNEFEMRTIPGGVFLDFSRLVARPDPTDPVEKMRKASEEADALWDIFASAMTDDEFERFRKFAVSADGPDMETLMEVMQGLVVSSATSFPTSSPSGSPPGQQPTGRGSTADASSPDSI